MSTDTARPPLSADDLAPAPTTLAVTSAAALSPAGVGSAALTAVLDGTVSAGPAAAEDLPDLGGETLPPRPVRAVPRWRTRSCSAARACATWTVRPDSPWWRAIWRWRRTPGRSARVRAW
ncbi:hypothetical protein [Streptomyces sirii]|uniref:hypothetical protein n=1 Tax=Streptomyces sirii TaxID=3127701 RepID=UPI003D368201